MKQIVSLRRLAAPATVVAILMSFARLGHAQVGYCQNNSGQVGSCNLTYPYCQIDCSQYSETISYGPMTPNGTLVTAQIIPTQRQYNCTSNKPTTMTTSSVSYTDTETITTQVTNSSGSSSTDQTEISLAGDLFKNINATISGTMTTGTTQDTSTQITDTGTVTIQKTYPSQTSPPFACSGMEAKFFKQYYPNASYTETGYVSWSAPSRANYSNNWPCAGSFTSSISGMCNVTATGNGSNVILVYTLVWNARSCTADSQGLSGTCAPTEVSTSASAAIAGSN